MMVEGESLLKQQSDKENWAISTGVKGWVTLKRIIIVLGVIGTVFILLLMVFTTTDVIFRYILGAPLKGAYEISELLFLAAVFLGMAYTQLFKEHINVNLLITHFSERTNLILETIMILFALAMYGLLTWMGAIAFFDAASSGEYRWGLIQIPLWPARLIVPIGTLFLCFRFIEEFLNNFNRIFKKQK